MLCSCGRFLGFGTFSLFACGFVWLRLINELYVARNGNHTRVTLANQHWTEHSMAKIYVITPTYTRTSQKAELTRLSHTLRLVPNVVWIVVEDRVDTTAPVARVLQRSTLPYVHLSVPDPKPNPPNVSLAGLGKGTAARNQALAWLRAKFSQTQPVPSVKVYFADDDNCYDLKVFEFVRQVRTIGTWPVAFTGGIVIEKPLVDENDTQRIVGWDVQYARGRPFAVDMAGFAMDISLLLKRPYVRFVNRTPPEHYFLVQFGLKLKDFEVFGMDAGEVYVWHTKTMKPSLPGEESYVNETGHASNANFEV